MSVYVRVLVQWPDDGPHAGLELVIKLNSIVVCDCEY